MAITTWAATTGDWDDSKFDRGWDGPSISPAVGSLSLSSTAPSVTLEINLSVGNADLELIQSYEWNQFTESWQDVIGDWSSGPVPHVAVSDPRNPEKADLTLSGSIPRSGIDYIFPVTVSELTTTTSIPTVKEGLHISPDVGSMEIIQSYEWNQMSVAWADVIGDWESGDVPVASMGIVISPAKADLSITAYSPLSGIMYDFRLDAGSLTLTGQQPAAAKGWVIFPDKADLAFINSYTWNDYGGTWADASTNWNDDAFVPSAVETAQNQPAAGELTLTGQVPIAAESITFPVGEADLTLSTTAPAHGISHFRTVGAGSLTGFESVTWADYSGDWASSTDSWGVGTLSPEFGITYTFPIDGDEFVLTTHDPKWPLVRDPNYRPQIILS